MKNILKILALISFVSTTNADYTAKFQLETVNGGPLPTGSINFGSSPTQPSETSECKYAAGGSGPASQWRISTSGTGVSRLYWEGVTLTLNATDPNEYTHTDGVKYVKGTLKMTNEPFNYFEICRLITN